MVGAPTQINPEYSTECTATQTKDLWYFPSAPFWWVLKSWRTISIVASSRTFLSPDLAARLFDCIFRFFTVPWASVFIAQAWTLFTRCSLKTCNLINVQKLSLNFTKRLFLKLLLHTPDSFLTVHYLSTITAKPSSIIIQKILGLM